MSVHGSDLPEEPTDDSDADDLANVVMEVVPQVLGQIPDLAGNPGSSILYTPSSRAAAEARALGRDVVEAAIRQGWSATLAMGEMHYALGYLLLIDKTLNLAPWGLVRSHLEMASRAAWIFDPSAGGVARIERSIAVQLDELNRSSEFVKESASFFGPKYGLDGEDAQQGLEKMWRDLEAECRRCSITLKPEGDRIRRVRKVGSTRVLGPGQMADRALGQKMDYELLSAIVHHRPLTVFSLSDIRASLLEFIGKVLQWFSITVWYQFNLCGFDLEKLGNTLEEFWTRASMSDDTRFWRTAVQS